MPALWQSSQRPMYIRTVWVDGFRHAILTHDDPQFLKLCAKRRRPLSSASCVTSTIRRNISALSHHDDFRNLNFVIENERFSQRTECEPHIEKLNLSDVDNFDSEFVVKASPQPLCDSNSYRIKEAENMRAVKSNRTARTDVKENTELSERVLQWLDLAGKVNLLAEENVERMSQPRHSWPEIQQRNLMKSKTVTELRAKQVKVVDPKTSGVIDRQEYYMPTSANTIENYARQSRNVKSTQRSDTKIKENKKVKDMRASVMETRQKMVSERNAVEKQYAEMVNKKMIPDVKSKKQVHIFMPEALNKKFNSTTPSVTESLLSQIS
ncbi:unnamed protein product, partial [Brenthis ino]